jgi:DNA polymerase-4
MRGEASVLHLDLDAFFAAVEQRDKPSLRGKPVVVGGIGLRGVVATASYEARAYGIRSAMPASEARRRCPHAAFLAGRHDLYREASAVVMDILRALSPAVEPLSLDEAFVDLRAAPEPVDLSTAGLTDLVDTLRSAVFTGTGGLTASVGVGTSKFIAKIASELAKPDGARVVAPGSEVALIAPLPVSVIPGVGPVTAEKLHRIGLDRVADLKQVGPDELRQLVGFTHAAELARLAQSEDDRPVVAERETKSISVEDTFEVDVVDATRLGEVLDGHARQVAARLRAAHLFARTVTIKVRQHDFVTHTRARTLLGATNRPELISEVARSLLAGTDTTAGVRLLGVGVAGLTGILQENLFDSPAPVDADVDAPVDVTATPAGHPQPDHSEPPKLHRGRWPWRPGADVRHEEHGPGWVWGAGLGRVTVRFETRDTPPGPVRTFRADDPRLTARYAP